MARASIGQWAFTGGEWGPAFQSRQDLDAYMRAVRRMENFIATPAGPATRRPGTLHVAAASATATRLIPFAVKGMVAIVEGSHEALRAFNGGSVWTLSAPYSAAQWRAVRYAQGGDALYLAHPNHPPMTLRWTGTAFVLAGLVFEDGPYHAMRSDALGVAVSGGAATLTATAPSFDVSHVGAWVRLWNGTAWSRGIIAAVSSSTVATAALLDGFGVTSAPLWRLGAWRPGIFPAAVGIAEGRTWWGRGSTIWSSCSGEPANFAPSALSAAVSDAHAITATLDEAPVGEIEWISSAHGAVLVGTSAGPCALMASSLRQPVTPTACAARKVQAAACGTTPPARVGATVVYASRTGRMVNTLDGDWTAEGYLAPDLGLPAQHLIRRGVVDMAYAQEPWSVIWAALADGGLIGLTYGRETGAAGWHSHSLGGGGKVKGLATLPAEGRDALFLLVERSGALSIEVMAAPFEPDAAADRSGMIFVDAAVVYIGPAVTEMTWLEHLEGQTVAVAADGAEHPECVVADGKINLQWAASVVVAGKGYHSEIETLDSPLQAPDGATKGRLRRANAIAVSLVESIGGMVGVKGSPLVQIAIRGAGDPLGMPPEVKTHTVKIATPSALDDDFAVLIRQDRPLPLTVAGIVPRVTATGE